MRTPFLLVCLATCVPAFEAQTIEPPFSSDYQFVDIGPLTGVPGNLGGITIRRDQPAHVFVVGGAAGPSGAVYRVPITRVAGHITGFAGPGSFFASAPNADGGLQFGPGGVLFFTRYNMNELGQIRPGSAGMDKSIPLGPLGVLPTVGGLAFVPGERLRELTLVSYTFSTTYSARLVPDGAGTYDISSVTPGTTLVGRPEGFVYIPPRSPQFTDYGDVLVCEWLNGVVSTFELDANGDPDPTTRRVFISDIPGCEGATIDPLSGDLLITFFGTPPPGVQQVVAVRGFGSWRLWSFEGLLGRAPDLLLR